MQRREQVRSFAPHLGDRRGLAPRELAARFAAAADILRATADVESALRRRPDGKPIWEEV